MMIDELLIATKALKHYANMLAHRHERFLIVILSQDNCLHR